jgi:excisionase family DNA binding protein
MTASSQPRHNPIEHSGADRALRPAAPLGARGSLLFAEDVAELVGMKKDWVYAETRAGRIPHVRLGRYYRYRSESIDAWIRELEDGSVRSLRARRRHG